MHIPEMKVSVSRIKEVFDYDPVTGILTREGKPVGTPVVGRSGVIHLAVRIDGYMEYVHRLAFIIMTGKLPSGIVDHRDGNGSNNRWSNIRDTNQQVNMINAGPWSNNTSGIKGVRKRRKVWLAYITVNKKQIHLGQFDTMEEAAEARRLGEKKYWADEK